MVEEKGTSRGQSGYSLCEGGEEGARTGWERRRKTWSGVCSGTGDRVRRQAQGQAPGRCAYECFSLPANLALSVIFIYALCFPQWEGHTKRNLILF